MIATANTYIGTDSGLLAPDELKPGMLVYSYNKSTWMTNPVQEVSHLGPVEALEITVASKVLKKITVVDYVGIYYRGRLTLIHNKQLHDKVRISVVYGFPVVITIGQKAQWMPNRFFMGLIDVKGRKTHRRLLLDRSHMYYKMQPIFGTTRIKDFRWKKIDAYNIVCDYDIPLVVFCTLQY